MRYQDCAELAQADEGASGQDSVHLLDANIHPTTKLATDYLNNFNEAIMLLDMLSSCPDCLDDFLGWRPKSYREHFMQSRFATRELALAAYEAAEPHARECLDALSDTMTALLEETRSAFAAGMPVGALAERTAASLKVLVVRAGAVINGEDDRRVPASK